MHRKSIALLVVLLLTSLTGFAQESTGNVSGTVTDPAGAVVPGAKVTLRNTDTGLERNTTTTSSGVFFITNIPVGNYSLETEASGFKKFVGQNIRVNVNDRLNIPVAMVVGGVTETVNVSETAAAALQTESAEQSTLIGAQQTQALPLNGRVFSQLVELTPGVVSESGTIGNGVGLSSDTAVAINGGQSNSNLWLLDGQNNVDAGSNAQNVVTPPLDALEEFKVLRSNYSAEFGGATGGVINVVTKQGTKTFHGSVYEYFRNNNLDANDYFLNQAGQPRNELRFNNFGYTLGGPFWIPGLYNKDKTKDFFFVSYEGRREVRGNTAQDNVPDAAERSGDLTELGEGVIPISQIDPNALAILQRYPLPNTATGSYNFVASLPKNTVDDVQLYRWDHNISDKAMFMVRVMKEDQNLGNINNQLWADDNFPSVSSDWNFSALNTIAKLTNIITPRVVNEFQFGYTQNFIHFQTSAQSDPTLASRSGFTYTELFPQTSGSFPTINGVDNFGSLVHQAPFTNREALLQWQDDLSWTFSNHNLKTGFFIGRSRKREPANGGSDDTAGILNFNSFADLMVGNISQYQEEQTLNPVYDRWHDYAIYLQDTWKVTSHLTLDLGLRWQYLGQAFSARDNIANFYPNRYNPGACTSAAFTPDGLLDPTLCDTLNGIVTPSSSGIPNRALVKNWNNLWEPRAGLAWSPAGMKDRLVFRTGGGIFHGRDAVSQTSALGLLPPNDRTATLNNTTFGALAPFNATSAQPPTQLQTLDPLYNIPSSYQYSAGFQYALTPGTIFDMSYVGSHQVHQGRNRDINQVPLGDLTDIYNGVLDANTVRPYLGYSHIYVNGRDGTSSYNSLQLAVSRNFAKGFQIQGSYAFSRLISDTTNRDTEGHSSPVQNILDLAAEKSLATQDQPHALTMNAIWQMPFFAKSTNGFLKTTLGGWELNGMYSARAGLPLSVCVDRDVVGLASGTDICERTNVAFNPNFPRDQRGVNEYFDTSAFSLQTPGTFGNAGRNLIRGPGLNNFDLSLFKNFHLPVPHVGGDEGMRLQFRAEFFNAFNHTQWGGVDTNFVPDQVAAGSGSTSSSFGTVNGAREPREIQFALKVLF
jgi:outer membrane receptor protein involved in Fe transport